MARIRSSRKQAPTGVDRLSALPDELLHTVMSFLPAPQAVQTSELSQRWRELWRTMPCLDIDIRDFPSAASFRKMDGGPWDGPWRKLENFATNLLMFHAAPVLDRFRLHVSGKNHQVELERWIRRGIKHNPAVLEVTLTSIVGMIELPSLGPSASTAACRLKRLHLCRVSLDAGFADHLGTRCPFLEDVELKGCECYFHEVVSATLKNLVIDSDGVGLEEMQLAKLTEDEKKTFPKLHNLKTLLMGECNMREEFDVLRFFLENVPSLEKVTLRHCEYPGVWKDDVQQDLPPQYRKLVCYESQDLNLIDIKYHNEVSWLPDLEKALGAVGRSGCGVASEMMETPPDMSHSK
ncbi:hypothetical protein EJB05_37842, partial [Eragrostis curvula]